MFSEIVTTEYRVSEFEVKESIQRWLRNAERRLKRKIL